jgi:hypothetical protein
MFEEQIKSEYSRITNLVATEQSLNHATIAELLSGEDFYYNFVVADSEYNNFQVLTSLASEKIYPDDLFSNDSALNSLLEFQQAYSKFDNEFLNEIITLAVDLRFNYTIRPVTTLLSFIFSDSQTITLQEAALKLKYFSGNDVILHTATSVLDLLAENENNNILTKSYFIKVLYSKLKYLIANIDSNSIVGLTDDIFSFMDELNGNNLLVLSLIIFFDDIRMLGVVEKLDSLKNNYSSFYQDSLREIIDELFIENNNNFGFDEVEFLEENQISELNVETTEELSINYLPSIDNTLQEEKSIEERIISLLNEIEKLPDSLQNDNIQDEESVSNYKNLLNNMLSEIQDTK